MGDYSAEEVADYDTAFAIGVREAMRRGTGLLVMAGALEGKTLWTAAYPPAGLRPYGMLAWARAVGLPLAEDARYLPTSEVQRAAKDLGI